MDVPDPNIPYGYTETWEGSMDDVWNIYQVNPHHPTNQERAEKEPVNLGIIGTGGVSQGKHLPSINRLKTIGEPVNIVSVADIDEDVGQQAADIYNATYYQDHNEMVDSEQIDAVEVTTPGEVAGPILRDVLSKGYHTLREKPLVYDGYENLNETTEEAREICELAEENDVVLMMGFCKRFAPPYSYAKQLIDEGVLGEPAMIAGKMVQSWTGDRLFEEQACHLIDVMRYLMGDVASITATGVEKYGVDNYDVDNAVITFEFESGSVGTLYQNNTSPNLQPWERIEVFGDDTYIEVDNAWELNLYDSDEGPAKSWTPTVPNTLLYDEDFGGYMWEIENFLDAVRGIENPVVDGWDGYTALEIARAAHESIETGERVSIE